MPAQIRPARQSDIGSLVAIEDRQFETDRISRRSFRRLIDSDTAGMLVADLGGAVRGYCMVLFRAGSGIARLYSIATLPTEREHGMGRALLAAAEELARRLGRSRLRLEVREENGRAIELYEKNGYRRIGRTDDYYRDGMAALRYEKPLGAGPQQ